MEEGICRCCLSVYVGLKIRSTPRLSTKDTFEKVEVEIKRSKRLSASVFEMFLLFHLETKIRGFFGVFFSTSCWHLLYVRIYIYIYFFFARCYQLTKCLSRELSGDLYATSFLCRKPKWRSAELISASLLQNVVYTKCLFYMYPNHTIL